MERYTTETFIEKCRKIHGDKYDYSKVDYSGYYGKICIICPEHGEFIQGANVHLNGKGCPKCAGKNLTKDDFIKLAQKKYGDKYDYSKVKYVNQTTKVCIICPEHGEFYVKPYYHIHVKSGCKKCKIHEGAYKETTEQFIEKAKKVHGDKYDYSKTVYLGSNDDVCIICPEHGEFWQRASVHLNGGGCYKCGRVESGKKLKHTHDEFYERFKKTPLYGEIEILGKYEGSHKKIKVKCLKCGHIWEAKASALLSGNGCPICNQFGGVKEERLYKKLVDSFGKENVVRQYRNKKLGRQSLDFYLPEYKIGIEYQGAQHFENVKRFGGEKTLEKTQERDLRKQEKCKELGILLLYVVPEKYYGKNKMYKGLSYYDYKKLEKRIKKEIEKICGRLGNQNLTEIL